jgi:hypothetical protein
MRRVWPRLLKRSQLLSQKQALDSRLLSFAPPLLQKRDDTNFKNGSGSRRSVYYEIVRVAYSHANRDSDRSRERCYFPELQFETVESVLSKAAISGILKKLIAAGFICHQRSSVDRRSDRTSLTAQVQEIRRVVDTLYEKHARTNVPAVRDSRPIRMGATPVTA